MKGGEAPKPEALRALVEQGKGALKVFPLPGVAPR